MTKPNKQNTAITVTRSDGLNIMGFNRLEKKNAITGEMYSTLVSAITEGDLDDTVRVHVLLGQPGVFTAGNDIAEFLTTANEGSGIGQEVLCFLKCLVGTSKPLIAGVDGLAIGIGTTLLLHFDLVYATPASFFQTPFTSLGLVPEAASSILAPRLFGHQRAFSLLAMGEKWSAKMALDAGLVNQIIESNELEIHTLEAAQKLAAKPPQSIHTTRHLLRGDPDEILARIDKEAEYFIKHLHSPEAQQAFTAFLNR